MDSEKEPVVAEIAPGPEIPQAAFDLVAALQQSAASGAELTIEEAKEANPLMIVHENGAVERVPEGFGAQANGDLIVGLTIPEYHVQSCKDFAEADGGKSLEAWCSEFFISALEAYCQPAPKR